MQFNCLTKLFWTFGPLLNMKRHGLKALRGFPSLKLIASLTWEQFQETSQTLSWEVGGVVCLHFLTTSNGAITWLSNMLSYGCQKKKKLSCMLLFVLSLLASQFLTRVEEKFPKDTDIIVACQKGLRSLAACELLLKAGYSNIFWVQGGLEAAEEEDLVREGPQPFKFAGIGGISEFVGYKSSPDASYYFISII
ncbi:unnamed protein product [Linum tenue]|uniref:Rhodanese domain-containing protein n=1 Tax=Linum tenue TaxID=586396 RepID=A0AAV0QTQ7_9ROSI|nr:unnamed protein product [Linum tenue]